MPDALKLITPYQEAGEKEVKLPAPAYPARAGRTETTMPIPKNSPTLPRLDLHPGHFLKKSSNGRVVILFLPIEEERYKDLLNKAGER